jgi:MFS family permease
MSVGSSRFIFVWLIGDLTDWSPAVTLLGLVVGLPALLLSPLAGALVDRLAPQHLGLGLLAATGTSFAVIALLVGSSVMNPALALVCALVNAVPIAGTVPFLQALTPRVVPRTLHLQAVALQNLGLNTSMIAGTLVASVSIAVAGVAGSLWVFAATNAFATLLLLRTTLPPDAVAVSTPRRGAVRAGLRQALTTQPLRSLLTLSFTMGLAVSAVLLLLPAVARDVLMVGSVKAGLLTGSIGLGLMSGSLIIVRLPPQRRRGLVLALVATASIGAGPLLLGVSRSFPFSLAVTFLWGVGGGVVTALARTLIQEQTPHDLMGRMMGIAALAHQGAFPVASLLLYVPVKQFAMSDSLVLAGLVGTAAIAVTASRPAIRRL